MKKISSLVAATVFIWLFSGALLIYTGNSAPFASIIAGVAALPLWFERLLAASKNPRRFAAWLDAAWLALFIYALVGLFNITSSEVVLTAMIMTLAFSKWKEALRPPSGEKSK